MHLGHCLNFGGALADRDRCRPLQGVVILAELWTLQLFPSLAQILIL